LANFKPRLRAPSIKSFLRTARAEKAGARPGAVRYAPDTQVALLNIFQRFAARVCRSDKYL